MRSKPKNGNRTHGRYCKVQLAHPKISKRKYEQQLIRAYCNEALEYPLAVLCDQYPEFKKQCMRSVGKSMRDEKAYTQTHQLEKEIQIKEDKLENAEILLESQQEKRNKFKKAGRKKRVNYLLIRDEANKSRETIRDLRLSLKCRKMLFKRMRTGRIRFQDMYNKMEKIILTDNS